MPTTLLISLAFNLLRMTKIPFHVHALACTVAAAGQQQWQQDPTVTTTPTGMAIYVHNRHYSTLHACTHDVLHVRAYVHN